MPHKLGSGIGVPYQTGSHPDAETVLIDGYYYQLDQTDPRTAEGWISGPLLHDNSAGDVSTFYQTTPGGSTRSVALLVKKSSGMTFDQVMVSPGFSSAITISFFGSNDLQMWAPLVPSLSATPIHFSMSYQPGISWNFSSQSFQYLAICITDSGSSNAQAGCADIRVMNGVADVGPA
ncbi:MAG: hypothetical protein BGO01_08745 [Armatimonadetes bacterium 55-13]|nr:hypothetical protein [Armatimonadota bacterium]OJU61949.1 MAG: hypothetical protein BGO01_08745 [Armatimonadetes bacterium 55-13]